MPVGWIDFSNDGLIPITDNYQFEPELGIKLREGIYSRSVRKGALAAVCIARRAKRAVAVLHASAIHQYGRMFYRFAVCVGNFARQRHGLSSGRNHANDQIGGCGSYPFPHDTPPAWTGIVSARPYSDSVRFVSM